MQRIPAPKQKTKRTDKAIQKQDILIHLEKAAEAAFYHSWNRKS